MTRLATSSGAAKRLISEVGRTFSKNSLSNSSKLLSLPCVRASIKCKPSSIYNLTRHRGQSRYGNPIPVLRLPMGLRFRRSSVLAWLKSQETTNAA